VRVGLKQAQNQIREDIKMSIRAKKMRDADTMRWDELNDSEKIERMRRIIKGIEREILYFRRKIDLMKNHIHLDNDNLVIRFSDINPLDYGYGECEKDEYF